MATKLSILSLSAILASVPLGSCQFGEQTIAGDGPLGLFDIPTSEYADKDNANATGLITFDRYSLSIAVKADVPIPDADSGDPDNSTMTSVISLEIDSPVRNQTTCVAIFHGLSANISAASIDLDSQDGYGCGRMLSDDCVSALLSAANSGIQRDCSGYLPDIPQSCMDQFGDMSGTGFSIQSESEQILYQHGAEPAAPGNDTLWTAAATNIWPVFLTAIVENGSSWRPETYLSCLRPDTFKEGTVRPSAEPNGTESGDGDSTGTGTTDDPAPSPTNSASQAGLTVAVAIVGLAFNAAMWFM